MKVEMGLCLILTPQTIADAIVIGQIQQALIFAETPKDFASDNWSEGEWVDDPGDGSIHISVSDREQAAKEATDGPNQKPV